MVSSVSLRVLVTLSFLGPCHVLVCEYVTMYLRSSSCGGAWLSSPLLLWNLHVSVYHEHGRCEHACIGLMWTCLSCLGQGEELLGSTVWAFMLCFVGI